MAKEKKIKSIDFTKETYKVKEVANYFKVGERVIYNAIGSGELKAIKVGRQYSISEENLNMYCLKV